MVMTHKQHGHHPANEIWEEQQWYLKADACNLISLIDIALLLLWDCLIWLYFIDQIMLHYIIFYIILYYFILYYIYYIFRTLWSKNVDNECTLLREKKSLGTISKLQRQLSVRWYSHIIFPTLFHFANFLTIQTSSYYKWLKNSLLCAV